MKTRLSFLIVLLCLIFGGSFAFAIDLTELKAKAEKGDARAQVDLGIAYADGQGVIQDPVEALKWWRKAADQGDAEAQHNIGVSYEKGEGATKDDVEAAKWFRKAANQGYAEAQYNLGFC